jgi:hypothetical protein
MDAGLEVMIFMGLILKIPVAGACWLIWHAIRAEPDPAESVEDDRGTEHRRYRREPKRPRGPRRGPHAPESLPFPCPESEGGLRIHRRPTPVRSAHGSAQEHRR